MGRALGRLELLVAVVRRRLRATLSLIAVAATLAAVARPQVQPSSDLDATIGELAALVGLALADGGAEWTFADVQAIALELYARPETTPATLSRGEAFVCIRRKLEQLAAPPATRAMVVAMGAIELMQTNERLAARAELEHGMATLPPGDPATRMVSLELAALEAAEGEWRGAQRALASAEALFTAAEREELDRYLDASGEAVPDAVFAVALDFGRWNGLRGELDLALGLPDRALHYFTAEERIGRRLGDANLAWSALDHNLRVGLAVYDYRGVVRRVEQARASGELDALTPDLQRRLENYEGLALYEVERAGAAEPGRALEILRAVLADPSCQPQDRFDAAFGVARILAESGRFEPSAEAIARARAELAGATTASGRRDPRAVKLDAIETAVIVATGDATAKAAALERFERSLGDFLASWADAATDPRGIAFLNLDDRYAILAELARACVAVDGATRGARRALEWVYRAQQLGGLARGLGEAPPSLEEALASVVAPRHGVVVLQLGRASSHLFLVDAEGAAPVDIAPDWKLLETISQLTAASAGAIRDGRGWSSPQVERAFRAFADAWLPPAALERIGAWECATIVGDEVFGHLPLDGVVLADGRRLGDVVALQYAPSLPVAALLARRARSRTPSEPGELVARIVGAPIASARDSERWRLEPFDVDPVRFESWSQAFERPAELAIGDAATLDALLTAGAQGVDALQVVAHGIDDASRQARAGFLLAASGDRSGEVWADEIETAAMPPLALLAVCGAGDSLVRRGDDGRSGLAASFALRGSECIVLTRIDLEVEGALDLFEAIGERVAGGAPPAHAIRDARRARGASAPLQDYMVYAWGFGAQPLTLPSRRDRDAIGPRAIAWTAAGAIIAVGIGLALRRRLTRDRRVTEAS